MRRDRRAAPQERIGHSNQLEARPNELNFIHEMFALSVAVNDASCERYCIGARDMSHLEEGLEKRVCLILLEELLVPLLVLDDP